jgi:lipopolysaccharide/colanic/teichoic acid biosynthesis glycosyltransferase
VCERSDELIVLRLQTQAITNSNVNPNKISGEVRAARSGVGSAQRLLKTWLDFAGAGVLILVLLPIFLLLGALVLADDGPPMIYRRRVLGRSGEFAAFKFRTMKRDADTVLQRDPELKAEFERNFKLKDDPRLTRLGPYLRKLSLDELPQLFNVLKGEMSLVGPRMITAPEAYKYGPYKDLLLQVKPGITGYWQVNGRQEVSYEERVRMDIAYIKNWSLFIDFKILFLTPLKVFKKEGAY